MNPKCFLPIFFGALLSSAIAQTPPPAQEEDTGITDTAVRNPFWQVSFSDGGHYMVKLERIASISRHNYLLDGAVIVDEVTVDTNGQALVRFYHLSPVTESSGNDSVQRVAERGRQILGQAAARAETQVHEMVIKKYPDTTHSKTIEYRLATEEQLTALYTSLRTAWENGRGRELSIVNP